jgi:hypothetical protein
MAIVSRVGSSRVTSAAGADSMRLPRGISWPAPPPTTLSPCHISFCRPSLPFFSRAEVRIRKGGDGTLRAESLITGVENLLSKVKRIGFHALEHNALPPYKRSRTAIGCCRRHSSIPAMVSSLNSRQRPVKSNGPGALSRGAPMPIAFKALAGATRCMLPGHGMRNRVFWPPKKTTCRRAAIPKGALKTQSTKGCMGGHHALSKLSRCESNWGQFLP